MATNLPDFLNGPVYRDFSPLTNPPKLNSEPENPEGYTEAPACPPAVTQTDSPDRCPGSTQTDLPAPEGPAAPDTTQTDDGDCAAGGTTQTDDGDCGAGGTTQTDDGDCGAGGTTQTDDGDCGGGNDPAPVQASPLHGWQDPPSLH